MSWTLHDRDRLSLLRPPPTFQARMLKSGILRAPWWKGQGEVFDLVQYCMSLAPLEIVKPQLLVANDEVQFDPNPEENQSVVSWFTPTCYEEAIKALLSMSAWLLALGLSVSFACEWKQAVNSEKSHWTNWGPKQRALGTMIIIRVWQECCEAQHRRRKDAAKRQKRCQEWVPERSSPESATSRGELSGGTGRYHQITSCDVSDWEWFFAPTLVDGSEVLNDRCDWFPNFKYVATNWSG